MNEEQITYRCVFLKIFGAPKILIEISNHDGLVTKCIQTSKKSVIKS